MSFGYKYVVLCHLLTIKLSSPHVVGRGFAAQGQSEASSAFARLKEAQFHCVQLNAAEKRMQRAAAQVERLRALVPDE